MSVLPDHQIRRQLRDRITPFDDEMVQPASYDCKLGEEFITFTSHEGIYIDLAHVEDDSAKFVTAGSDGFVLHPGEFILGVTAETVHIPDNMVARIEGKSSIGRLGIMVHVTAGYIDPGFHGPITLEMTNLRKIPIILRPGKPVCQLSFHLMSDTPSQTYDGRYQGAKGVQPSRYGADPKLERMKDIILNPPEPEPRPPSGGLLPPYPSQLDDVFHRR